MTEPKWCSIDGRSWLITIGDKRAAVWLMTETYGAHVWWGDGSSTSLEEFDCLKKAKAACIEAIEDAQDVAEAEAVMADGSKTIPWDEMELKQRIAELEAELAKRIANADSFGPWVVIPTDQDRIEYLGKMRQYREYIFPEYKDAVHHLDSSASPEPNRYRVAKLSDVAYTGEEE